MSYVSFPRTPGTSSCARRSHRHKFSTPAPSKIPKKVHELLGCPPPTRSGTGPMPPVRRIEVSPVPPEYQERLKLLYSADFFRQEACLIGRFPFVGLPRLSLLRPAGPHIDRRVDAHGLRTVTKRLHEKKRERVSIHYDCGCCCAAGPHLSLLMAFEDDNNTLTQCQK